MTEVENARAAIAMAEENLQKIVTARATHDRDLTEAIEVAQRAQATLDDHVVKRALGEDVTDTTLGKLRTASVRAQNAADELMRAKDRLEAREEAAETAVALARRTYAAVCVEAWRKRDAELDAEAREHFQKFAKLYATKLHARAFLSTLTVDPETGVAGEPLPYRHPLQAQGRNPDTDRGVLDQILVDNGIMPGQGYAFGWRGGVLTESEFLSELTK